MINILAGALLMTACAYIGIGIKRIYKIRNETFSTFERLIIILKGEIKHHKTPHLEVVESFIYEKKGIAYDILKKYLMCLKGGVKNIYDILDNTKTIFLSTEDNKTIANFLFSLGKNNIQSEIENLERYELCFKMLKESAEDDCVKKGNMYYKLSVLLGVALMIIVL